MNIIDSIISEKIINTLGWTLIHSLWQGAIIALAVALAMLLMKNYSSRTRYFTGIMALVLMFLLSVGTFVSNYNSVSQVSHPAVQSAGGSAMANAQAQNGVTGKTLNGEAMSMDSGFFVNYFKRHLPLIVTLWLMGLLVTMLRFAGSLLYNRRLRTRNCSPLPVRWQQRFNLLCRKTGIPRKVGFLQSALVKVPMVTGYFKPVILMPIGMVTGMPVEQVEALLAHELAHILRKDYLVNMLQSVLDILYFYHPGLRWVSALVRTERENCCDDMAVTTTGNTVTYARALTNVQGVGRGMEPAMAITGDTPHLLNRIKRLLNPNRVRTRWNEGMAGALVMVFCLVTLTWGLNAAAVSPLDEIYNTQHEAVAQDWKDGGNDVDKDQEQDKDRDKEKNKEIFLDKERENKAFEKAIRKAKQKKKSKSGRKIRPGEKKKLSEEQQKVFEEERARLHQRLETREKALHHRYQKVSEMYKSRMKDLLHKKGDHSKELARLKKEYAEKIKQLKMQSAEQKVQLHELHKQYQLHSKHLRTEDAEQQKKLAVMKAEYAKLVKDAKEVSKGKVEDLKRIEAKLGMMSEKMQQMRERKEKELAAVKNRLKNASKNLSMEKAHLAKELSFQKKLIAQLREDGLINSDSFEFALNRKGMWVNGKKQPKSVFKKYRKMIVGHSGKLKMSRTYKILHK